MTSLSSRKVRYWQCRTKLPTGASIGVRLWWFTVDRYTVASATQRTVCRNVWLLSSRLSRSLVLNSISVKLAPQSRANTVGMDISSMTRMNIDVSRRIKSQCLVRNRACSGIGGLCTNSAASSVGTTSVLNSIQALVYVERRQPKLAELKFLVKNSVFVAVSNVVT